MYWRTCYSASTNKRGRYQFKVFQNAHFAIGDLILFVIDSVSLFVRDNENEMFCVHARAELLDFSQIVSSWLRCLCDFTTDNITPKNKAQLKPANKKPLKDHSHKRKNRGGQVLYILVVPSLSTKFITNSHQNLPV